MFGEARSSISKWRALVVPQQCAHRTLTIESKRRVGSSFFQQLCSYEHLHNKKFGGNYETGNIKFNSQRQTLTQRVYGPHVVHHWSTNLSFYHPECHLKIMRDPKDSPCVTAGIQTDIKARRLQWRGRLSRIHTTNSSIPQNTSHTNECTLKLRSLDKLSERNQCQGLPWFWALWPHLL